MCTEAGNSESGFEFITYDGSLCGEDRTVSSRSPQAGHERRLVNNFSDLKAAVYPPNPEYNIAEKPWLPGPQKPYLIFNAKVVDPRAGVVRENMSLHLAGGKIVKVVPTTAHDREADFYYTGRKVDKIDAGGYYVCPGLIDCETKKTRQNLFAC